MSVYVAMINDRHCDPEPYVFSTAEAAIGYARSTAMEYARSHGDFEEHISPPPGGWLYYATYSVEGDSVWVVEKKVDGD